MINEDRLKKALTYLSQTDEPFARAKALAGALDDQKKTVLAGLYVGQTEGSNNDKGQIALASKDYQDHLAKLQNAVYDFEILRNKRLTEEKIIETWRSLNSARSKGVL